MAVYRERDGDIVREYSLQENQPILRKQADFALLEWIPTKAFGRCLFLDNELQFAESDEYIYHEALVHPCLAFSQKRQSVCILGGGDGCAAREVLKWSDVGAIDILDWDSKVTRFFQEKVTDINQGSLDCACIQNVNIQDCIHDERSYDCLIVDLLDPDFTKENQMDLWYDVLFLAKHWTAPDGCIVINLGGILPGDTDTVVSMVQLLQERIDLPYKLYKVFVPSFAREWCFVLLGHVPMETFEELPSDLKYMSQQTWEVANAWSSDYKIHVNPLSNP